MTRTQNTPDPDAAIRNWVLSRAKNLTESTLDETTPLLEARHITSLHVPELLLLIESLRQRPVDLSQLRPGDLKDLRTISARFFQGVEP